MGILESKSSKIPLWVINLISIISGLATIATSILAFVQLFLSDSSKNIVTILLFLALIASVFFNVYLFFKVRKYVQAETIQIREITRNMHHLLHRVRNVFFEVMHDHKKGTLNEANLSKFCKSELEKIMNNLCSTMGVYTSQKIFACIKLITYGDSEEKIDEHNATLVTFCRSEDSKHERSNYEENNKPILLCENSDFFEVVSKDFEKTYFYQGDLIAYDREKRKNGERYKNSNPNWEKFYRGTIVVPIRIKHNKLYHIKPSDAYHIIGFLCVDSESTEAFTKSMEKYLVDMMYAYADIIYILLGQYRHYLKKFENNNERTGMKGESVKK